MTTPEVLAPAGSPDCLPAAVAGGAHAVFLGLRHFNARGRAENFRLADLPRHVGYLHRHGVKCYVVLNTLVHDDEHPKALKLARAAHDAGVDAAIIQDLGLWRLLTREVPGLKRHASTQMSVMDPSHVEVLARLGAERVILARELALPEVAACTAAAAALGVQTEHFVHGALCYAVSGQCLMSNFAGCRSANRGTCAQNCRFDYATPGAAAPAESQISMKDFALVGRIPDLAAAGVASLKIEGRLKGPDYVYTVSRVYRAAVDAYATGTRFDVADARELLKDVFARPHTEAPLDGDYSQASRLHRNDPGSDRTSDGTLLGFDRVRGAAEIRSSRPIAAGQGFRFTVPAADGSSWNDGFLVLASEAGQSGTWRLRIRTDARGPKVPAGTPVFRNADHARKAEAQAAMAAVPLDPPEESTVLVDLDVSGAIGAVLTVVATSADGRSARVASTQLLAPAASAPLTQALLADKLGAFGGTGFRLGRIGCAIAGDAFLPATVLKELRRDLVAQITAQTPVVPAEPEPMVAIEPATPLRRRTKLWVACGSLEAARAAHAAGADAVWLDDPTIDWWQDPPVISSDLPLWVRLPATSPVPDLKRIGLPIVCGHLGQLAAARTAGLRAVMDLAANVYSTETLAALRDLGAEAAVLSLELSAREVVRLAGRCAALAQPLPALALVVHGRVPSMLTRQQHDLEPGEIRTIAAVTRDGGLPYELQRRRHDTVVWEARRLSAPQAVAATSGLVDAWVLELADLGAERIGAVISAYSGLRDGSVTPAGVTAACAPTELHGIFPGHLEIGARELDAWQERA